MITLDLNGLSFSGAEELLKQEGYIPGECIEKPAGDCERVFLYPYSLHDADGRLIDRVYHAEYCVEVEDSEYTDGKKTWDVLRAEWMRL